MIGDNPSGDIAGANAAGWNSILVETGIYSPKDLPFADKNFNPTYHVHGMK